MHIHEMPYVELKQICDILDQNNKFEELGLNHMRFDQTTIQDLYSIYNRGDSPTQKLLTLWSHQNHTVDELFILLSRMKQYRAMTIIKKHVNEKYHFLLRVNELSLEERFSKLKFNSEMKTLNSPIPIIESLEDNNKVPNNSKENNPQLPVHMLSPSTNSNENVSELTIIKSAGLLPHIPYDELMNATNQWSSSTILGKGGFGTVFKGVWKQTEVAIKRIEQKDISAQSRNQQINQSITELQCLNAYRHDNILPLYGYSVTGPQPCLVYQYMSGGSLEDRLRSKENEKILNWDSRLNIAIGTARGLQFLHTIGSKPLIHGDIKSANILLDDNDKPRIGDFGLAREGPESNYMKLTKIHGTRPYLPNEFLRNNKFSTKVDTYSFGVVLFEISTALPSCSSLYEKKFLRDFIVDKVPNSNNTTDIEAYHIENTLKFKDKRLKDGDGYFKGLIRIGLNCVKDKAKERPEMVEVLLLLLQLQETLKTVC